MELLAVDQAKAEREAKRAEETLEALEVRAPHDGTFVIQRMGWGQRILQAGDRAFSGMRVAEVATNDRMDAEVAVLEADAGGLAAGKRAQVVLDARPDLIWKARVKKVDPFPKPKHPEVPTQYFGALLSIEGNTAGVKPGQRLRATIVLDEMTSALAVPRQAVFRHENATFVYRRRGWGTDFEKVPVTLGAGHGGAGGGHERARPGDRIALRDPSRSADEVVRHGPAHAERGGRPGASAGPPETGSRARPVNLWEAFRSALDGVASHKLRSGLTMLGIMFGVGAVISMLSIGAGAARQAQTLIDQLGMRNVLVRARAAPLGRACARPQEVAGGLAARRRRHQGGGSRGRAGGAAPQDRALAGAGGRDQDRGDRLRGLAPPPGARGPAAQPRGGSSTLSTRRITPRCA